ncbi:MAG: hypothetical protein QNJ04_16015, partial [Desulfobacterales bacterium]|nr:hypothetical protein [Desulfobacterales bacterium]
DEVTVIHPLITVDVEYRLAPTAVARVESVDNRIAAGLTGRFDYLRTQRVQRRWGPDGIRHQR